MDDIVFLAKNESEAIDRLKKVLKVSSDYGLEINFGKCQFLHRKIEFLSHIIENNKLYPSPSKTKTVVHYPEPKTTKEVQRFLGLTGYFRKFIPAYSVIAKPLSDLLRKDTPFNFDVKQKASFDELKRLLCQKPVLGIYRQNCETEIYTDASIDGLAAVLLQRSSDDNSLHPIYYMSRNTSETERKYTSYELEEIPAFQSRPQMSDLNFGQFNWTGR
ncbi:retrovirus-related Pol polyprotein from transposon 297 [Trichonephila inaurata madagascariensis]|uniref:Retrovirus-related Pol polyprotein from transposon 297 n=1 Tax=Trichonephila inaurata madagascariensis TaxID=2747483 RepID=A0A8X6MBN4_9ARAC|nr:retrovirus-related Pol polyprotein from transposon 297 [Trichonephila inaurata madagascariensis]